MEVQGASVCNYMPVLDTRGSYHVRVLTVYRYTHITVVPCYTSMVETHFPRCPASERATPLPSFRVHYEEHSPAEHLHKSTVHDLVANWVGPTD